MYLGVNRLTSRGKYLLAILAILGTGSLVILSTARAEESQTNPWLFAPNRQKVLLSNTSPVTFNFGEVKVICTTLNAEGETGFTERKLPLGNNLHFTEECSTEGWGGRKVKITNLAGGIEVGVLEGIVTVGLPSFQMRPVGAAESCRFHFPRAILKGTWTNGHGGVSSTFATNEATAREVYIEGKCPTPFVESVKTVPVTAKFEAKNLSNPNEPIKVKKLYE